MKRRSSTRDACVYWNAITNGERMDADDIRLLNTIRNALREGVHYTNDMRTFVANAYGFPLSDYNTCPEARRVEGGTLGMEIYHARRELDRIDALAADVTAAQALKVGDVLKGVRMGLDNFSTVTVVDVKDNGQVAFQARKRGSPNTWRCIAGASALCGSQ